MLNNIKLGVKQGGQRGHSIPYHHQQSPPTPPHGGSVSGPFRVNFQFSNLDNIDSMLPFFSMFPYSMLNTFPSNHYYKRSHSINYMSKLLQVQFTALQAAFILFAMQRRQFFSLFFNFPPILWIHYFYLFDLKSLGMKTLGFNF